ncbi:hypothetical protein COP2_041280 [Malus domestica]
MSTAVISQPQPFLTSAEQDSVYTVLSFVNLDIPWRSLFPDDLCLSAPHGVVCNFFYEIPLSFSKMNFELIPVAKSTTDITSLEEVCRRVNAKEGNGWV